MKCLEMYSFLPIDSVKLICSMYLKMRSKIQKTRRVTQVSVYLHICLSKVNEYQCVRGLHTNTKLQVQGT